LGIYVRPVDGPTALFTRILHGGLPVIDKVAAHKGENEKVGMVGSSAGVNFDVSTNGISWTAPMHVPRVKKKLKANTLTTRAWLGEAEQGSTPRHTREADSKMTASNRCLHLLYRVTFLCIILAQCMYKVGKHIYSGKILAITYATLHNVSR
jgi:hypothetical protein